MIDLGVSLLRLKLELDFPILNSVTWHNLLIKKEKAEQALCHLSLSYASLSLNSKA